MSSGFITESEAQDVRKRRQEEWERVRKEEDPLERPEEPYDTRSLFERLQEQKQKKDLEYEEAHKLKNMIKGLDDDEIEFLDLVDRTKLAADKRKSLEEEKELNDYRSRVATLQEKNLDQKLQTEMAVNKPKVSANRKSQLKLLEGAVIKKLEPRKRKHSDKETAPDEVIAPEEPETKKVVSHVPQETNTSSGMVCIGILPGLGCYDDSSSDENSSSSSEDNKTPPVMLDMLGRKIVKNEEN